MLDIPDIFLELTVYAGPKPTYDEKMRDFFDRLDSEKRTYLLSILIFVYDNICFGWVKTTSP